MIGTAEKNMKNKYTSAQLSIVIFASVVVAFTPISRVEFVGFSGTYWFAFATATVTLAMTTADRAISASSKQVTTCIC